ncbi:hypothetical protein INS49_003970 [Diaporthe citri]|uniref:uncharacterized protein n=1 Tax=Diaporthe citri TaxID=83186 RepID=UPI001C812BFD|nr:uncharacterized protein INS49_003970 [Diaporthe citri]KAG6354889.1 hypothetical protein INS49_003970 [Diaporthe citri]
MEDTGRARCYVNWIIHKCKKGIKIQKSIERNRSKSALDHLLSKHGDLVSDVWKTAQMREHRLAWAVKELPDRVRERIAELLPEKLKSLRQSDDSWRKLVQVWETKRKRHIRAAVALIPHPQFSPTNMALRMRNVPAVFEWSDLLSTPRSPFYLAGPEPLSVQLGLHFNEEQETASFKIRVLLQLRG